MHLVLGGCINFYIRNKSSKNLHPTSVFGSEFGYKLALAMRIVIAMILKSESISKSSVQKEKKKKNVAILRGRDKIYLSSTR